MKVREYDVLIRAIEEGLHFGLSRHNKYAPRRLEGAEEANLLAHLEREIASAICGVFDFESSIDDIPESGRSATGGEEPPDDVA